MFAKRSRFLHCNHSKIHFYHHSVCHLIFTGTLLGKGVYFARDASISARYASGFRADVGNRCVYLAKVLVGQYCQGNQAKSLVPPPKDPSRPEILFDSVVNDDGSPSIFAVFFDNQCYPEYLIKF